MIDGTPPIGSYVYSATRVHDDGEADIPGTPLGGIVIEHGQPDPDTGYQRITMIEAHRGRICVHVRPIDDLEYSAGGPYVNKRTVRAMARLLHADMARHPSHDWLHTLLVLSMAERPTSVP